MLCKQPVIQHSAGFLDVATDLLFTEHKMKLMSLDEYFQHLFRMPQSIHCSLLQTVLEHGSFWA